jgi:hypothetical protein
MNRWMAGVDSSFIEPWLLHTGDSRRQQTEASPIGVIYSTLFHCDERHFWNPVSLKPAVADPDER